MNKKEQEKVKEVVNQSLRIAKTGLCTENHIGTSVCSILRKHVNIEARNKDILPNTSSSIRRVGALNTPYRKDETLPPHNISLLLGDNLNITKYGNNYIGRNIKNMDFIQMTDNILEKPTISKSNYHKKNKFKLNKAIITKMEEIVSHMIGVKVIYDGDRTLSPNRTNKELIDWMIRAYNHKVSSTKKS